VASSSDPNCDGELRTPGVALPDRLPVVFPVDRPLGAGRLQRPIVIDDGGQNAEVVTLAALLSYIGSIAVSYRYLIPVLGQDVDAAHAKLKDARHERRDDDGNYITLSVALEGGVGRCFVATPAQRSLLQSLMVTEDFILGTNQVISDSLLSKPYMVQALSFYKSKPRANNVLQLYPFNEVAELQGGRRGAPVVTLNRSERDRLGRRFLVELANPESMVSFNGHLRLPVIPRFHKAVPPGRAVVHESLVLSLGVRPGELIAVDPTRVPIKLRELTKMARRRTAVMRVRSACDPDVGHDIGRITEDLFEVLGLAPGERVTLIGRVTGRGRALTSVRALPGRWSRQSASGHGLDIQAEVGRDNLPRIALDLVSRQALGVVPGSPVLVRPAYGELLADEAAKALTALAVGATGSLIADKLLLGIGFFAAFIVILTWSFIRRFS
jgi:hypothetical protein